MRTQLGCRPNTNNRQYRDLLSNDLGAVGALLFDIGSGKYTAPPREGDQAARERWQTDVATVRAQSAKDRRLADAGRASDRTHAEVQRWLRDLGVALGFDVYVAANDRGCPVDDGRLGDGCLEELPSRLTTAAPGVSRDRTSPCAVSSLRGTSIDIGTPWRALARGRRPSRRWRARSRKTPSLVTMGSTSTPLLYNQALTHPLRHPKAHARQKGESECRGNCRFSKRRDPFLTTFSKPFPPLE